MDEQNIYIEKSKELKLRHEEIKNNMLKLIETIKIVENQYNELEKELYAVEEEYINNLNKILS